VRSPRETDRISRWHCPQRATHVLSLSLFLSLSLSHIESISLSLFLSLALFLPSLSLTLALQHARRTPGQTNRTSRQTRRSHQGIAGSGLDRYPFHCCNTLQQHTAATHCRCPIHQQISLSYLQMYCRYPFHGCNTLQQHTADIPFIPSHLSSLLLSSRSRFHSRARATGNTTHIKTALPEKGFTSIPFIPPHFFSAPTPPPPIAVLAS